MGHSILLKPLKDIANKKTKLWKLYQLWMQLKGIITDTVMDSQNVKAYWVLKTLS